MPSAQIIFGDLDHNVSPDSIKQEISKLVEGVEHVQLNVVTFSTPGHAARAMSRLPSTYRIGAISWKSVEDYRDHKLKRSSGALKFLGCAIIAVPLFMFFLLSLFFHLDPAPVQAFENQSVDVLSANVLASGMSHTCGDSTVGECLEDRACTGVAKQLIPTAAEVQTVENTHGSRRQ
eukprot:6125010-Prymnesium_polylepis.1